MPGKISIYIKYSKPKVWWLLVFIAFGGAILAINSFTLNNIILILVATVSVTMGSMGAEGLTNYIDLDMDSTMERTKNRPLPQGQITKRQALIFGYSLAIFSVLILIVFRRFLAALFMSAGIFDNVFIYSYLLKKISPYSIIYGGFSGAFPVLIGWYTVTSAFSWLPWILFFLVMFWIPVHVWSLAYRYREDYRKANVPMYPVTHSDRSTAIAISFSSILLIVFSITPYFLRIYSLIYLIPVAILSVPIIIFSYKFIKKPDKNTSFSLFVYTAPYLTFVFILVMVLNIIRILNIH
ncbi:heme o synthase [Ferroplasma sp.]|uniref:heme o synthase n=1 Tax=Ferroplasma sp. TaxID=2591003 RepID=UPI00307E19A4